MRALKEPLENRFRESNLSLPDRHSSPQFSSPPPQVSLEREGEQEDSLRDQEGEDDVVHVDDVMNLLLWPEPYQLFLELVGDVTVSQGQELNPTV